MITKKKINFPLLAVALGLLLVLVSGDHSWQG